ncbi:hypothetical protein PIB30_015964, partial [Stylosanthes scabra]|nr:hypothetical protein [Stylosanthes scabra]
MASNNGITSTFISLILFLSLFVSAGNCKVTVEIINTMKADITVHCKSKDDDLGFHTLKTNKSYQFRFNPRIIFGRTLYYCSFIWSGVHELLYLDVYDQAHDKCDVCLWRISYLGGRLNDGEIIPWK